MATSTKTHGSMQRLLKKNFKALTVTFLSACLLFLSFTTAAQTAAERSRMNSSIEKQKLSALQQSFNAEFIRDEKNIADFLRKHPSVKRSFVDGNSVYYLVKINPLGIPVYINTKNKASGELIKANELYSGGSLGVNITGTGMVAGVWDGGQVRATHELLSGHVAMEAGQTLDGSGSNYKGNNHMTHVSGTMVGKDIAGQPSARGIAYNATAKNYDWTNDKTEATAFAASGYLISNHSYGYANDNTTPTWQFGAYDDESLAWDQITKNAPNYLPFVAAGNEQQSGNPTKAGYDIITGASASKNVVTVGAVNGDMTMSDYSNWGPTDEGRVKPDIVAKGTGINSSLFADETTHLPSDNAYSGNGVGSSGTSYASPAAAASGLLLQQYYNSLYGTYMKASTLKGLMLATATDLGQPGPDAKFGWGLLNIEKAAKLIKNKTAAANPNASSNTNTSALSYSYIEEVAFNPAANSTAEGSRDFVANGCEPLVVAFSWTDDEGVEQTAADGTDPTATRLAYDFDFMVRDLTTFTDVRPWKPVSMANRTGAAGTCTTWFDVNYNNFKEVIIPNPVAGRSYRAYFRKKTGSPSAARTISVIASGLRILGPTGSVNQSFCGSAQISNLSVTGTAVQWYDAATAGNLLPSTTALVNGTTYYASQTIDGCASTTRLAVTVSINSSTAAPTGSASQSFCTASTVANLTATGSNIKWYDASTAGNLLASTTALTNGATYYASQTVGSCESTTRLAVTVTLGSSTAAPTGTSSQSFCNAATVANLTATGSNIKWYDASTAGNLLASTTALVNGSTYYASQTIGSCESPTRLAVTVTIGSAAAPTGTAAQSFCNAATVANLTATGTNIKWYDAATAGNLLPSTTALVNGSTYYASQTIGSCESTTRFAVTVTIGSAAAPTGTAAQTFCNAATVANLTATGSNIKWYDASTAGNLLPSTTALVNGVTYYASQTVGSCESTTRFAVTVTISSPAAPTGTAAQTFCNAATVANLTATGSNIKWYDASTAGNLLASTTALVNGSTYYSSQTIGSCESTTRFAVTVTISSPAAPTGTAAQTFCNTGTVANLTATGTNIKWYDAATAGNLLASTTALVNGSTYYASQTIGSCESTTRLAVTATINVTPAPTGTAAQTFCNAATVANLTVTGSNIKWYNAATAGTLLASTTALVNGSIYYASQTIGTCESATRFAVTVTINVTAAPTGSATQTFCNSATVANLSATGTNIKWYDAAAAGNLLTSATALANGSVYYASQTIGTCESATRLAVTATINAPAAPTGTAAQTFCAASTVANLSATGSNIKWYDASAAGNLLPATTALTNGTTYYASQTIGTCESVTRFAVTATVTILSAPTGNAVQNFCAPSTVADLTATGTGIKWYDASTAGNLLSSSTALVSGATYYASQSSGICESASRFAVTINITMAAVVITPVHRTALAPSVTTSLYATVSPQLTGNTFTWYRDGNVVPNVTRNVLSGITVDALGLYTAKLTTATGCQVTSAGVLIKDSVAAPLFISPNPSHGVFQVRYYSATPNNGTVRFVSVYSSNGTRVFTGSAPVTASYSKIDIDITRYGRGFYTVILTDAQGKKLATGKVEVL